jgi:eukaryotic-like serine/threonine-protein kinase
MANYSPQPAPDAETSAMAAAASSAFEGRRIGPYQLTARIGAGGMGEVYRATDTRLNRTVAIKVLHPHVAGDPQARERFKWEATAVAALNHPHIRTLYDVGSDSGHDYLVMEFLEGQTVAGPLPLDEALPLAMQIASALEIAHQRGILHRDLKPSNVMRTKSGAKLLDFGLAKPIDYQSDVTRTVAGLVLGTVAYMSPEQAEGKPLDPRSDIFSFGVLLYEMLAGRPPFVGDTSAALVSAVLRDEPAPLAAPSALQQIVRRCLAKPATQRFETMGDVKAALEQVTPTLVERPSIAVLPFTSLSPDPENEYFSDGIAEEIINALTQIKGLHVAARTSSFSFKGKPLAVGEIAARLNVRHLLEGSVRKAGGRVRVTAQLVDASNGYQLWSERYDRELADIFDVQDEIARAIVARLKVALVHDQPTRLVKVTTENIEAYQHYLKGRAMLYRRGPWIPRALESLQTQWRSIPTTPRRGRAWRTRIPRLVIPASGGPIRQCRRRCKPLLEPRGSIRNRRKPTMPLQSSPCCGNATSRRPDGSFVRR